MAAAQPAVVSTRKHKPKKRKEHWRKIDVSAEIQALDAERSDLRTHGVTTSALSNDALFSVDRQAESSAPRALTGRRAKAGKPTAVDRALVNHSKMPALHGKPAPRKRKEAPEDESPSSSAGVAVAGPARRTKHPASGAVSVPLWDTSAAALSKNKKKKLQRRFGGDIIEPPKVALGLKHITTRRAAAPDTVLPAVLPHPAESYRPEPEVHERFLLEQVQKEKDHEQWERRLQNKLQARDADDDDDNNNNNNNNNNGDDEATREQLLQARVKSKRSRYTDHYDDEADAADDDAVERARTAEEAQLDSLPTVPRGAKERRQLAEKRKAEKKMEKRLRLRQLRARGQDFDQELAEALAAAQKAEQNDSERAVALTQAKAAKLTKQHRLGPRVYVAPPAALQLPSEVPTHLGGLHARGNLLSERFHSLEERNVIEPRVRFERRRRYKLKMVEKHHVRAENQTPTPKKPQAEPAR